MTERGCTTVEELIAGVQDRLASGRVDDVTTYLNQSRPEPSSLAPYLHHEDAHYTRNLIFKNELFELLALCWGVGHRAWIHNHEGQHCWMSAVEGTLTVRNFRRLGCDQQLRTVNLRPTVEQRIFPGSLAEVDPSEPVHAVWNPPELNERAVSLHVYSLPFDTCVIYDGDQGLCRNTTLSYTSEHGKRTDHHRGGGRLLDIPRCVCTLTPYEQDTHCGAARPPRTSEGASHH